ncbi:MAG: ParB/RepB/Spo0J family partition protein [Treponema sp.]|nr:ParB/RepB/Spo0J family partition protein [Treponema sp.]
MAKHGLGKGLGALLPVNDDEVLFSPRTDPAGKDTPPSGGERSVALEKLRANPSQPRKYFDDETLRELADSIREHGIIQPIIAEDAGDGTYIIVAGERRSRAARMAGLTEVPVILRDYSEEKRMEVSLVENVQRADLNPIEEAEAYKGLMDLTGLSQDEVALRVGKNRSTVANALRLLKLPKTMRQSLETGEISPGHARAILSVSDPAFQETLFREILEGNFSVREAEKRAGDLNKGEKPRSRAGDGGKRPPEIGDMEEKFIKLLGTKVAIDGDLNRGTIRIDYYSMEDLERLYEILAP